MYIYFSVQKFVNCLGCQTVRAMGRTNTPTILSGAIFIWGTIIFVFWYKCLLINPLGYLKFIYILGSSFPVVYLCNDLYSYTQLPQQF